MNGERCVMSQCKFVCYVAEETESRGVEVRCANEEGHVGDHLIVVSK